MKRLLSICALLLVGACAWTPESVVIQRQYVPVAAVPGSAEVAVNVVAADSRQEREISHKKNGYGMRAADISAVNDVVTEVRAGVVEILHGMGFREGQDAAIRIELSRFYNTFDMGFWSATANAQAIANLQVLAADGRSLYSRIYTSNYQLTGVQIMSAENAGSALRTALHGLLRQIADDPHLPRALLQARPEPTISGQEPAERSSRARSRVGA